MKFVITGGTGMIGSALAEKLLRDGHEVTAISRDAASAALKLPAKVVSVAWSSPADSAPAWKAAVAQADVVINLAGESVGGGKWTPEFKQRLTFSRIETTARIVNAISELPVVDRRPQALISASAVGYYGDCRDEIVQEEHAPGRDFLAGLCVAWENEAMKAEAAGIRVVRMRIGLVLAKTGALEKILYPLPIHVSPMKLGLGGPLGSGRQWWPWIHIDDVVGLFQWAAENSVVTGPINVTSPGVVTNADFTRALGRVLKRPEVFPTPAPLIRLIAGEFATALLTGQRAIPSRALAMGYKFAYPEIEQALRQIVGNPA